MINESGIASNSLAGAKKKTAPGKVDPQREGIVSEQSIKFHTDGASEGENNPDTATSVSLHIASENSHSANSSNPRATNPAHDISPSYDIQTASQAEIQFDVTEEPAPSSEQSLRIHTEESRNGSIPGTSPKPTGENIEFHEETPHTTPPQRTIPAVEAVKSATVTIPEAEAPAPAAPAPHLATYPPPRRLSKRALLSSQTPRTNSAVPTTPLSRSPNSSHRPAHHPPESTLVAAGVPPLAPVDETKQAEHAAAAAVAAAKPQAFARNATSNSDFSAADGDVNEDVAAVVASVTTPASPNIVVTNHSRVFKGPEWAAVVETSRDTVERTVGNETAEAVGVEAQFVRVTSIEADQGKMTCGISIGHTPEYTVEQIDEAIQSHRYENTRMLLEIMAGHRKPSQTVESETSEKQVSTIPFSFSTKVGDALIRLHYAASASSSYRHLELSLDCPIEEVTIKLVKECLSEYLVIEKSELVVRRDAKVLSDGATGASLGLTSGCLLEVQRITPQPYEAENVEPQRMAPIPTPAPQPKRTAAKRHSKDKGVATPTKGRGKAPAVAAAAEAKKLPPYAATKKVPKTKRKMSSQQQATEQRRRLRQPRYNAARGQSPVPRYASLTRAATAHGATPQPSMARSRARDAPLPRMLTTPRVYHPHSLRPGAERLEEGETMAMYMSASRSPSRSYHTSSPAAARHSLGDIRAPSASLPSCNAQPPVPQQHTVRGVASVVFHTQRVAQAAVRQPVLNGAPRDLMHHAVEHRAEAHSASIHSYSPPHPAFGVANSSSSCASDDDSDSSPADENEHVEAEMMDLEEALRKPHPKSFAEPQEHEDDVEAEMMDLEEVLRKPAGDDADESEDDSVEHDYSGEPLEPHDEEEEDPVPAAVPNPFV
ncbi:hypothetical protein ABL78_6889 [Leptomonas seymouri]|uniref:Flagellar attachment zone protein 1 conserved domain-containing protein n=1 Tax=Leptomonas seymouri TaxID=5684 RepID=A0A0N1PBR0_LEPSE|nr:hypothetical protein ABL78_6889 [Leptomonas seymouri]|eukprot:KPI84064.1 hypothetical protein ABL78_6889 [Leptomonas seymouri]